MNKYAATALTGALALAAGGALAQQPEAQRSGDWDRESRITLYEHPDFQGRSMTFDRSDPSLVADGFNDRARSARVSGGSWRLCEDVDYRGRCETVRSDVRDLASLGMDRAASSVQQRADTPGPFPPGGDPDTVRDSVTLYEYPDFQGRSITLNRSDENLVPDGWNDLARSVRVRDGSWTLCEHVNFGGRCERVDRDVRNLAQLGFDCTVSSVRKGRDGDDDDGGWPGGGWGNQEGVQGRSVVFYRRPSFNGEDIAGNQFMANLFCRLQGHGQAVYFDARERGRRARGEGGRFVNDAPVLRDVLCRRR